MSKSYPARLKSYVSGFIFSVVLTLLAYYLVVDQVLVGWSLVFAIVGLAVVQLAVQLFFFLHLGHETKPRWNLIAFLSAMTVVLIVVFGSLWIINNLNYSHTNQRSPQETEEHLLDEEAIPKNHPHN